MQPPKNAKKPFLGLRSYQQSDHAYFVGREQELGILYAYILTNRLNVFYGPSGVGKTSLLQAGVQETFEKYTPNNRCCILCEWSVEPFQTLLSPLLEILPPERAEKVKSAETLYEELLLKESEASADSSSLIVLILDQFEQFFLEPQVKESLKPVQKLSASRQNFLQALYKIVNDNRIPIHIVISIREDWFTQLDILKTFLPSIFRHTLRLDNLFYRKSESTLTGTAVDAIRKPIAIYCKEHEQKIKVDDNFLKTMLGDLGKLQRAGALAVVSMQEDKNTIHPANLQLVMRYLWENWAEGQDFTLDFYRSVPSKGKQTPVEFIVNHYVERALQSLKEEEREYALEALDYLAMPGGLKRTFEVEYLAVLTEIPSSKLRTALDKITGTDCCLLHRSEGVQKGQNGVSYEVLQDSLVTPLRAHIDQWKTTKRAEELARKEKQEARRREVSRLRYFTTSMSLVALFAVQQQQRATKEGQRATLALKRERTANLNSEKAEAKVKKTLVVAKTFVAAVKTNDILDTSDAEKEQSFARKVKMALGKGLARCKAEYPNDPYMFQKKGQAYFLLAFLQELDFPVSLHGGSQDAVNELLQQGWAKVEPSKWQVGDVGVVNKPNTNTAYYVYYCYGRGEKKAMKILDNKTVVAGDRLFPAERNVLADVGGKEKTDYFLRPPQQLSNP